MQAFFNLFRRPRTWRNDSRLWHIHVREIQNELDAERAKGYGFRAIDGRRIDF